ncbi:amidohydrolase family protein [Siminovitchia sp. 179-K 8D1 HS]|uniref:metal-dependent hydrolase family protein n=1 Tax=Siminovitchia sp. 179-K 8D1 HS TaxID=3142385 RepID=UPI0039A0836A
MSFILKNCRLIPELSGHLPFEFADITVEDRKIRKIAPSGSDSYDGHVIECEGKTLLPGIIDLHIHLHAAGSFDPHTRNDFEIMKMACKNAKLYLQYGITTVRDVGSTNRVAHAVRDAINEGVFVGPRIISGGKIIRPTGIPDDRNPASFTRGITGHNEMVKAVREEFAEGADMVKIYASGSALQTEGVPTQPILFSEEIRAAVEVANMNGKYVAAHCHSNEAIHMCLDEGVYTIEHGTYVDDAAIEKLKEERSYLVPTLTPMHHRKPNNRDPYEDAILEQKLKVLAEATSVRLRAAYEAGLKMGFGTDVSINTFDVRTGMEFKMRKELCGMKNIDILLQATKHSAFIAGLEGITGEIKEGYEADLILVDGKPDIHMEVMFKKPELVFKSGFQVANNTEAYDRCHA